MIDPPAANEGEEQHPEDAASHCGGQSQASLLVSYVTEQSTLFHDANGYGYVQDPETGECRRIGTQQFSDWIVANFYKRYGKAPRDAALKEALTTLNGLARFDSEEHEVYIRVALHQGVHYLDLAQPGSSRTVSIRPGYWTIVEELPVRFLRPKSMRPLPDPELGGQFDELWEMTNIPEGSRLLTLAWLIECLRSNTPFPVLELMGEQGSAKSTTQAVLRRLIDPNASNLRAAPKNNRRFICVGRCVLDGEFGECLLLVGSASGCSVRIGDGGRFG